jgi:hypothetical protein
VDEASTEDSRSQVPYGEGVAIHTGPESCGGGSNAMAEALTGVRIGQVLSREMLVNSRVLTPWVMRKAIWDVSLSRDMFGLCAVADLGMYANTMSGNREIPCLSPYEGMETASGSPRTKYDDERVWEVGQFHST